MIWPEEVVPLLGEDDLRHGLGDLAYYPGEVPGPLAALDAVEAVDAGALEERVRRLGRLDAAAHDPL